MELVKKQLDCVLLRPKVVEDLRGKFTVPFSIDDLREIGLSFESVCQVNHSFTSKKGTVRGPNYQKNYSQAKVIRCIKGSLYSVGVCLYGENKGKHVGFLLTASNMEIMYMPRGYAHGFVTLEDDTELEYITDNKYDYASAKSIKWDALGIDWTLNGKVEVRTDLLSDKNKNAPEL